VALPRPWWPEKEGVFATADEGGGRQIEDEGAIHLLVEIEIEAVERLAGIAEAGLLVASVTEPVLSTLQFVADEHRDEIEWRHAFGLRMLQAGWEYVCDAREAQLPEGTIDFGEGHVGSPVF
jgi:hypothetical protein